MGRLKRKLSPLKSDSKVRKLSAFGFCKADITDNANSDEIRSNDCENNSLETENCVSLNPEALTPTKSCNTVLALPSRKNLLSKQCVNRKFRSEWQQKHSWLVYDPVQKLMFCKLCKDAKLVNSFTTGCSSMKLENVQAHEKPKGRKPGDNSHMRAIEIMTEVKECETARVKQLLLSEAAVISAMRNVVFLAEHDLPNSLMTDLNSLCKEQGASQLQHLKCDKRTTYEHNTSVTEFEEIIANVLTDELIKCVHSSPFFSVTLDESTDITVNQNLIVYIVYLVSEKGKMIPTSRFLGLVKLSDGATAQLIYDSLLNLLSRRGLDMSKLCGIATDGAAVMTGCKAGLVQKVKEKCPGTLSVHCIAHRLALSSGGAADKIIYLVKFQDTVNALYKYFQYSPKHSNQLRAMQEILEQDKKIKLKQVFHTRWLSFDGALKAVLINFSSLVSVLLADKSAKSAGLVKSINTYKFLYTAHFLADVMHYLCRLSKSYQVSGINFSSVYPLLHHTVTKIRQLQDCSGENIHAFLQSVPQSPVESDTIPGVYEFEFGPHVIKDSFKQRKEAKETCVKFCNFLIEDLEMRFDSTGDSAVLSAVCDIFNPRTISGLTDATKVDQIGTELNTVNNFCMKMDPNTTIRCEMLDFLDFLKSNDRKLSLLNNVDDVIQYAISEQSLFPQLSTFLLRYLATPVSTVDCERGFSRHNLIKTKTRNCLKTPNVENLMVISMLKPGRDFPYMTAFQKWVDVRKRRVV